MHPAEQPDELLQCYDEEGNPTEAMPRAVVKEKPFRYWYAVTKIWLVNNMGEILCTKRSERLSANPGKWQTYVGGHVSAGDTFLQCALKELAEEVGVLTNEESLSLVDEGRNPENRNFYAYYAMRFNGDIADLRFTDDEVSEAKWMSIDEYRADEAAHPEQWCCGITPERQILLSEWFAK